MKVTELTRIIVSWCNVSNEFDVSSVWEDAALKDYTYPVGNYMFKVKNRNTRTRC